VKRALAIAAALLVAAALWAAPRPAHAPGVATRDFEAYWAAGRTALERASPYQRGALWARERTVPGVSPERDELLPFVSPPMILPVFASLARLPYAWARAVWLSLLALACALGAWAAFRLAGFRGGDAAVAGILAVTFSPLTATLALGQVSGIAFAGLALALVALRARSGFDALALACSAVQPNLAIAALAGARRATLAPFAVAAALVAAATAASLFAFGGGIGAYAVTLLRHGASETGDVIQFSLSSMAAPLIPAAGPALAVLLLAASAALAAAFARRSAPERSVAFACALLPFAMPFFHDQDLIAVLIPAAFALAAWQRKGAITGALGALFVAVDWLDLAQQPASRYEDVLLAAAAACAVAALHPTRRALWLALPVAIAGMLAPLAAAHPVPIWPFSLPPHFHVPANLGAAATWAREQRAAGLLRTQPLAILLRSLALLGCALLALSLWSAPEERAPLRARATPRSRTPGPARAGSPADPG